MATVDIPGAFFQTRLPANEKEVHVVIDGQMAKLLANISPETYQKYVHHKQSQAYIYCKSNVALYGTLKSSLLFWKKLTNSLNQYDWFITNKMVNRKQLTIVLHVDDLKMSHKDSMVKDEIILSLKA